MKKWVITTLALMLIPILIVNLRKNNDSRDLVIENSPLVVTSGNLQHIDLFSPEMNETIKVDVWTPNGYCKDVKYPVIYMHDGQNLFDANSTWNHQAWEIDSVMGALLDADSIKPAIIVGVYSVDTTRLSDLMPEKPLQYLTTDSIKTFIDSYMCKGLYRADEYLAFIVNTLRPVINENYSTDTTMQATSIMGSSMGGLISIYGLCEYPEVFGAAGCLSTHWSGAINRNDDFPNAMRQYLIESLPLSSVHQLYMDCGDKTIDSVYIPYFHAMNTLADSIGFDDGRLMTPFFPGHAHEERAWASRVAEPLKFILRK